MKLRLNSPCVKITAATVLILSTAVVGVILNPPNNKATVAVNSEKNKAEPAKPPTLAELEEMHSSWRHSSSESASLIDGDDGFQSVTIGGR